jgi:SNF2 family DNA or RNA helicase
MQVVQNKALMFVTKKHEQINALIPKSKVIEVSGEKARMLVNWGFEEWRILKNMGIKDVPHPIWGRYTWPGVYTPFDHQRTTAAFLASHPRCYCLNEAGTGKTSAAAWAADYLLSQGQIKRVLVVCPVSIMDTAWRADLFRTVMHRSVGIASGTRKQREAIIEGGYEFVIINFDGVKVAHEALKRGGFDLIIVDEANYIKSVSTDRWKALASLASPSTWIWAMTGTPAAQSPLDAYGLARLVNPNSVPRFIGRWRDMVMTKVTQYKYVPRPEASKMVFNVLQPAVRFTKEECLDLPELLYTTRDVALTDQQSKYYKKVKHDMIAMAAGEEITAVNAASQLNKLLQIAQGAVYTDTREVVDFDVGPRLDALKEIVDSTERKVIVFVPYRHVMERVQAEMVKHLGNSNAVEVIHGGVAAGARADTIKRFQTEENPRVLIIIPAAAAHGITLTKADQVVWWGPVSSTEIYLQANARAHRAGQTNKVTVTHLQGSPVERRMYNLLQNKIDMHNLVVDLFNEELA